MRTYLLALAGVAALCMGFVSCSDDSEAVIEGDWCGSRGITWRIRSISSYKAPQDMM